MSSKSPYIKSRPKVQSYYQTLLKKADKETQELAQNPYARGFYDDYCRLAKSCPSPFILKKK